MGKFFDYPKRAHLSLIPNSLSSDARKHELQPHLLLLIASLLFDSHRPTRIKDPRHVSEENSAPSMTEKDFSGLTVKVSKRSIRGRKFGGLAQ